jgi:hypothetical protein
VPIGSTTNISILVLADVDPPAITLAMQSCTIEVEEVPLPTG